MNDTAIVHEVHDQQTDTYVVRFHGEIWVCTVGSDPGLDVIITPEGRSFPAYTPDGSQPFGVADEVWACLKRAWDLMV